MNEPNGVARLRRAAAVLRERATEAGAGVRWRYDRGAYKVFAESTFVAEPDRSADGYWIAMVDPAVGSVLAEWLDVEAKREAQWLAEFGYRVVPNEAHELARQVLREDETTRPDPAA